MNNPLHARLSARCSSRDISSTGLRNVALDVKIGKERRVDIGPWGSATAEIHGVWTMETLAEAFGFDMT